MALPHPETPASDPEKTRQEYGMQTDSRWHRFQAALSEFSARRQPCRIRRQTNSWRTASCFVVLISCLFSKMPHAPAIEETQAPPPSVRNEELFQTHIRTTAPLSAEKQRDHLHVPDGFRVDLVACEPEIAKPMNLAFSADGRLWVSSSREYPFAAEPGEGRDTIRVFEDQDGDGEYDSSQIFADRLNIPIGLLPWHDGVICFSIPNLIFLKDTDGDGRADEKQILYGPFDTTRDTHGLVNSLTMGPDGWIYACHGFNNQSQVAGTDGHRVHLQSGNVFRFRPDGSRIELFTQGQVNPFGLELTPDGLWLSADCHTKPISWLTLGGCYDSFGRPHDGLGYVPAVMQHLHGSTAIAGIASGRRLRFGSEYEQSVFGGNVATGCINQNHLHDHGGRIVAEERPNLLVSSDPWFRPVDLRTGPDGDLYVADFYNRIIGHYEVDLKHPGRDRHRGRIWRISRTADAATPSTRIDSAGQLLDAVRRNLTLPPIRQATNAHELVPHDLQVRQRRWTSAAANAWLKFPSEADVKELESALRAAITIGEGASPEATAHLLQLVNAVIDHPQRRSQVQSGPLNELLTSFVSRQLSSPDRRICRLAAEAAGRIPSPVLTEPVLNACHRLAPDDTHLRHVLKIALKNLLQASNETGTATNLTGWRDLAKVDAEVIASVLTAADARKVRPLVISLLPELATTDAEQFRKLVSEAASALPSEMVDDVLREGPTALAEFPLLQAALLNAVLRGDARLSADQQSRLQAWVDILLPELLGIGEGADVVPFSGAPWTEQRHPNYPDAKGPVFAVTKRRAGTDGSLQNPLHSSLAHGEQKTGVYRSISFAASTSLKFYLAGHDGYPNQPPGGRNMVRLREAGTHRVLRTAAPPRNDTAALIEWDTADLSGLDVYVEISDGDPGNAYAWLAAGRFSVDELNPGDRRPQIAAALQLLAFPQLHSSKLPLESLTDAVSCDPQLSTQFLELTPAVAPEIGRAVQALAAMPHMSRRARHHILIAALRQDMVLLRQLAEQGLQTCTTSAQKEVARAVVSTENGRRLLRTWLDDRLMQPGVLRDQAVWIALRKEKDSELSSHFQQLRLAVPEESDGVDDLIRTRTTAYSRKPGRAEAGAQLFRKHCMTCHRIAQHGNQYAPNLDGIRTRGIGRLAEDILAPNRHVDSAFHARTLILSDGRILNGLLLPADPQSRTLQLIDSAGRQVSVRSEDIEEEVRTALSPMPANFRELLTEDEFSDLLAFLMSATPPVPTAP